MYNNLTTGDPQDKRFFGIYRGVVADNKDPIGKNRVRMLVPQILGEAITSWSYPIVGVPVHQKTPYISVVDNNNQPLSGATPTNTAMVMSLSNVEEGYGITVVDDNKLTFQYSGVYNIQFSVQLVSTNSSLQKVQIWIANQDGPITDSAGEITISGNGAATLPSWNYVLSVNAGEYIQLYWATDSSNVYIASNQTPIDGAAHSPGVTVTATLAGNYTPEPGDGCWVMFEGGDPNFPLWLGAF